jgi:hypothetical protein
MRILFRLAASLAHQPQHKRQQQSAEKQAYNSDNYDLDRIHDANARRRLAPGGTC